LKPLTGGNKGYVDYSRNLNINKDYLLD
jgi:hypothetical protein